MSSRATQALRPLLADARSTHGSGSDRHRPRRFRRARSSVPAVSPRSGFGSAFRRDSLAMIGLAVLAVFVAHGPAGAGDQPAVGTQRRRLDPQPGVGVDRAAPSRSAPTTSDAPSPPSSSGDRGSACFVGVTATLLTIVIGAVVGIAAGFFGGRVDAVLMRLTDWFLVIPFLPLAIVLAAVLDRSLRNIVIVIAITSWPGTARIIRAQVLTAKRRLYVDRASALGAGRWHVVRRHVLPAVAPLILASTTLAVPISSSPRRRWRSSASATRPGRRGARCSTRRTRPGRSPGRRGGTTCQRGSASCSSCSPSLSSVGRSRRSSTRGCATR